jgi:hypothetical protein
LIATYPSKSDLTDALTTLNTAVSDHVALPDPHDQYAEIAGQTFTGDIEAPGVTATGPFTSLGIDDNATSTAITIDSDENVGIGTTNPQYKLDISTDADDTEIFDSIRLAVSNEQGGAASSGLVWAPSFSGYTKQSAAIKAMSEGNFFRVGIGFFTGNTSDESTDAVERMRIDPSGNVGVGTETPTEKLDVDGSIRASTGILFGTDTAAANTLDDYEEGTWTPVIGGGSCTNIVGKYTKVGNKVTVTLSVNAGILTGATTNSITGLPFTNGDTRSTTSSIAFINLYPNDNPIGLVLEDSATVAFVYNVGNGTWLLPDFTNASGAYLHFSATYFIN